MRDSARGEAAARQNSSGIEGLIRHAAAAAAAKDVAKDARTGPAPARFPVTISEFKRAQTVLSVTLLVLCTIGSLVVDQTSLIGNRIFMPILTILLTSANEVVYGIYELCQERHLTKRAVTAVAFGLVAFTLGAICFGAPLRRTADTVNWAFFISALTLMPGACLLSDDIDQWKRTYLFARPQSVVEKACCTLFYSPILGGWFGAWVILLDWNRSWQVWPIPSFVGSVVGYFSGSVYLWFSLSADLRMHRRAVAQAAAQRESDVEREMEEMKERAQREEENRAPPRPTATATADGDGDGDMPDECNESNWWLFL
jgi:hypothetical protein